MKRLVCMTAVAVLGLSSPTWADPQGDQDNQTLDLLDAELAKIKKRPDLYDGKAMVAGIDLAAAGKYIEQAAVDHRAASRLINKVSARGNQLPRFRQLLAASNEWSEYINAFVRAYDPAMNAARKEASRAAEKKTADDQAAQAQAKQRCDELASAVEWNKDPNVIYRAIDVLTVDGELSIDTVKSLRPRLDGVAAACNDSKWAGVAKACDHLKRHDSASNRSYTLAEWCSVGTQKTKVLEAAVMNKLAGELRRMGPGMTMAELKANDGWLKVERPIVYNEYTRFSDTERNAYLAEEKPLFDAAGVDVPREHALWTTLAERKDKLRAAVDELAPTWKLQGQPCAGYGCAQVKKSLTSMHANAKVLATHMTDWKIHKNGFGLILDRTMSGWVLYQLPGEKWCQSRSWTQTEVWQGSKYKPSTGIPLYFVRFQACK